MGARIEHVKNFRLGHGSCYLEFRALRNFGVEPEIRGGFADEGCEAAIGTRRREFERGSVTSNMSRRSRAQPRQSVRRKGALDVGTVVARTGDREV